MIDQTLQAARLPRKEAGELLDLFPAGVILLSPACRVIAANRGAERILCQGDGLELEGQRLRAASPEETQELRELVRTLAREVSQDLPEGRNTRPISRPSGRRPLQVLLSRLGAGENGAAGRRSAVALFVTDPEEAVEIPMARLQRLYGLTLSEARIASHLAAGRRPEVVAAELGVQTNTVRMHLKRIFAKTNTHRQSELVALLLRSAARLSTQPQARNGAGSCSAEAPCPEVEGSA